MPTRASETAGSGKSFGGIFDPILIQSALETIENWIKPHRTIENKNTINNNSLTRYPLEFRNA